MIRSNIGNVASNAMGTLSISATTAKRFLGKADTALNNLTKEEQAQYKEIQTDKLRNQIENYNKKKDPTSIDSILDNEKIEIESEQANNLNKKIMNDINYMSYFDRVEKSKPALDDLIAKTTKNIKIKE